MHNNKGGDEEKTEPKENDKWMENNDHDKDLEVAPNRHSRLDELRGRAKKFASNKYHLIIVLLCVLLFILFIIVIALAVQLGTYKCAESNECRSAECLSAASSVVARLDLSQDPCNNFFSYSCDGWMSRNPLPKNRGSYSLRDQLKEEIYSRIRHLIDLVPHDSNTTRHQWKVKAFYQSCLALKDIEYWVPEKILQAIREIGGWAIIKQPGGTFNRNSVLMKLHVSFGVSAFFQILVEPDDRNPLRNIIKIVPGGLGLPGKDFYFKPHDDMFVKAYKTFIKHTMQEMGVTLNEAIRFADDVFYYEKRIAEITPTADELRNTKDHYAILTVKELDRLSTSISWTDLLQRYFPDFVNPDTEIAVLSEKYFTDISKIISSTDNGVLNNYCMWRFMHAFVSHSSPKFRLVVNHFKQSLEGVADADLNLPYQENWESCVDVTSQFLGHAIGAMYISKFYDNDPEAQTYLHKLVGSMNAITNDIPWLREEESHVAAESKIRSLLMLSGRPNFIKDHTLDMYYEKLVVQTDYFQNIKNGIYFLHVKQEEMLKNNAVTDYSWTIYPHNVMVDYKYAGNQLVVPAGLFGKPLFDFNAPLAMKYGALAAHVGNKLGEVFDEKGINYNEYGVLKDWAGNSSVMSFKRREQCLKNIIANYSLYDVTANADLTVGSLIAEIGGVKLAYEAYARHAKEENEVAELPGVTLTNKQLFFVSYAQSLCQIMKPEKLMSERDASTYLPNQLRVLGTLQQLPEFSAAFSCPRNSVLNSREHCSLW